MKLEKIIVKGLFGVFNHEIVLKEHITILVSENGYGKTTILKMVEALFEQNFVFFHAVVFKEFILEFDKEVLTISKDNKEHIYFNGTKILDVDDYQKQMLITIENAFENKTLPSYVSIEEIFESPNSTMFDEYKERYNNREILNNKKFKDLLNTYTESILLETNRVSDFYLPEDAGENSENVHFATIMNYFLVHKELIILDNKITIKSTHTNKRIPLTNLSSGESHLFTLFYDLIFEAQENTFVLLDEPEISLHISWQKKFISTLQEIVAFKPLNILIATHAPSVVGSHWNLVVELNEPTTV